MNDRTLAVSHHVTSEGFHVVAVAGDLDHHTAPELGRAIDRALASPAHGLIIDLSRLAYCDSTGISVLIDAYRDTDAAKAPFGLAAVTPNLADMLAILGLDRFLSIYPSVHQAIEVFTHPTRT
ncbi:STAS domain-containing protein [Actinomadura opuntiae]|uniref:STAS domain-containing protein n=1 Tax=Actinomadura sp. OS1-43 TaxID=604315 RepID=UPI00255AFCD1|nr:STAS domain-containing protein [Actinomadura sp. OS1-43]MDL4814254.1 STAS domain-containing protein [Actinomadura sp. OS1-43]